MQKLIENIRNTIKDKDSLPFSVYSFNKEQRIINAPFIKPMLVFVLAGKKYLGANSEIVCPSGNFIFLSNTLSISLRNIPDDSEYFAVLIEFEYSDFDCLAHRSPKTIKRFQGQIDKTLEYTLQQFVEWSTVTPPDIWHLRRQEILQVLAYSGFNEVASIAEPPTLTHKIYSIISANITSDVGADALSSKLAMSESTLRRKLKAEGSNLQTIKDKAKLGYGLHLVETSSASIGQISEQCGYSSQSRFTDKFKQLFDVTPTELRKTRMTVSGE